jgi:arylsulfatase A-like enzyme
MSIFTGQYPVDHGVRYNADFPLIYGSQARNLITRLRERGYATGCFITTQVFGRARNSLENFDHCDFPRGSLRPGVHAAYAASAWLREKRSSPSFVWLHLYDPHSPYGSSKEKKTGFPVDLVRYGWIGPQDLEPEIRRRTIALYERGVRDADRGLGVLMDSIKSRLDDVLVIAVADHGEYFDEQLSIGYAWSHGALLGDEVLRIPLILAGPGVETGRSATAVSIRDLYTTILAAAEIGDRMASAEKRLDLRAIARGRRIVIAERRSYTHPARMQNIWGAAAWGHVQRNTVAAMDGKHLVVLGEDSLPAGMAEGLPKDLLIAASRHRAAVLASSETREPKEVDAESERMLRELGYLD